MKRNPDPSATERLYQAAMSSDPLACSRVARDLISSGLHADQICDVYIPAVARRMGEDWVEDEMSFSRVTIGSARLQFLLREIGPGPSDDPKWDDTAETESILLILTADADHTLGILVLAHQLRRRGFSVRMLLGESRQKILETVESQKFDAIFLSATMADSLDSLHDVVTDLRTSSKRLPPVILGGYVVEQAGRDALEVTGVDKVTNDLGEALEFCSLATSVNVT